MASIGKAFTSISCGIMMQEKRDLIPDGLDTRVFTEKLLPEAFPLSDPRKAGITLGQLLSMTSGMHGDGGNPGIVKGEDRLVEPAARPASPQDQDTSALRAAMWTQSGEGYAYASNSPHVASIVLRHLVGMEMQEYIDRKLAQPMGFGTWGYALHRNGTDLAHTPGGGGIALRATDALRFAYMLLHQGRWGKRQLVAAGYVAMCARPTPYNPHSPMSLMFEVNADGHVFGAPRDAFFKSGAGGSALYVVPSLDLVIYKMSCSDAQLDPALTGLPATYRIDHSRDSWKPGPHDQFHDGPVGGDDGVRRLLEMVAAGVMQ
jgi:CubicO group peptidase (beta-lactamase class C family)